ncbi:hypothetical protein AQUCO_07600035v1 [Aquilegia coerulea]|uniref:Uncharacterized protein n=1 Tax=Aquilegia coerulea TaxID=218851 RepID=A0A2G5C8G9_AQUCA|nr:hypothetical protein AQUCO_07600035v1 [Aquilegia coerulea]
MTSSLIDISATYGRVVDIEIIVSKLLTENSHHNLHVPVISVVGTGGFGKTTLAQMILKEEQVIANFEKTMWVCVSEPFDIAKVAKQIIEEAGSSVPDAVGWQAVHESLSKSVQGKCFLLVLDDVWTYNDEQWRQLKLSLDCGGTGSRIIVTTRNERIGKMMGSIYIHRVEELSEDASWSLFRRIAFLGREEDFEKYEDIGMDIAKKCKGVPLAVKTLAVGDEDGFLPSLMLSYYALPSELKPCFLYCAIFPKDATIKKDELVKLWMAQGFLGSCGADGSKDLETIGGGYFDNLAMRSFFQGFKKDNEGNLISCIMHDLVHDFAQFLAGSETLIVKEQELSSVNIRHVGVGASNMDNVSIYEKERYLRTLRPLEGWWDPRVTVPLDVFNKLKCLRALSLHGCKIQEVPDEVEKLLHLRFLDLSRNNFVELPEAICGLLNLQTLKLFKCYRLRKLPIGLGKLSNLRHLEIKNTYWLSYIPCGIGRLSHLRTLDRFVVCDEDGCKLKDLRLLNQLQGNLSIYGLERVADVNEGKEAELKKKENLCFLTLNFGAEVDVGEVDGLKMQGILEGFQPHRNLETLNINYYRGFMLPFWISSLSNLVNLVLYRCSQCLQLPALGRLISLEYLELRELSSLKHIGSEWYGLDNSSGGGGSSVKQQKVVIFPKLKKLEIWDCVELEEWVMPLQTDLLEFFPNLLKLELIRCEVLWALPAFGNLKSLEKIYFEGLGGIKCLGLDFLGISSGYDCVRDGESASTGGAAVFPALTHLGLCDMEEWDEEEEEEILPRNNVENGITTAPIMPCLTKLMIDNCPELKVLPEYLFPEAMDSLLIRYCPQLTGTQPCLPLHLDCLCLEGNLGVVTSSLLLLGVSPHTNYPNLRKLEISDSQQDSLPQGFNLLTGIETLRIKDCPFLDFLPEDLKHLTVLKELEIIRSPILRKRYTDEVISQLLQRI